MAELHETAAHRLRSDDQRYTTNRRAVVETLAAAGRPLTIPQLLERRRDLAVSSLYRNLAVLERAGVVHRIVTDDEFAHYELAEDLTGHHHHSICARCGAVDDFTLPASLEAELDKALRRIAGRSGFRAGTHRLDLLGTCADCT